ncbi:hypothetical protein pb186bvf_013838 [Paramecium bursaria]
MKQQKTKSPNAQEQKLEQQNMTQLIAKARAIASQQKSVIGPLHIRNDSAQIKKDTKSFELTINSPKQNEQIISKQSFTFEYVIGIGGFGKVWKVDLKKSGQSYAMKEMSKALQFIFIQFNKELQLRNPTLLSQLKHPYLVNMYYAFQDRENLYVVMDYMKGGDLRFHVGRMRKFNEDQTKFFLASIFMGLEYLHNNNIIHRDIKPENLVLDEKGYVRITDLGIARQMKPENSQDTSGTPGYMAPEVMCRQNHSFAVDYYALGVIGYEFMLGRVKYYFQYKNFKRDHILEDQDKKQEIKSQQNKFKQRQVRFLMVGHQNLSILQID